MDAVRNEAVEETFWGGRGGPWFRVRGRCVVEEGGEETREKKVANGLVVVLGLQL